MNWSLTMASFEVACANIFQKSTLALLVTEFIIRILECKTWGKNSIKVPAMETSFFFNQIERLPSLG